MIADGILDIDSMTDDSSYEDSFDNWIVDQGEYTPLLRRSTLMEESGFRPKLRREEDRTKKAIDIWTAYKSGAETFIKQINKENVKTKNLSNDIKDRMLSILESSILPYAFGEKGSCNSKEKQIKKIEGLLEKGLEIDFISPRINRVIKGIREMYTDILYWGWHLNAKGIKELRLTNSDLHNRGLGVLFVTFIIKKNGMFRADETVTKVIKPEDKSLEKELLGKGTSLAEKLNEKEIQVNGESLIGKVTTLDIQTSRNHGSMIEFFKGEQINRINEAEDTESDSKTLTKIFAALTGMDDLHYENLIYQKNTETGQYDTPAMIDADNALSKRIFGNLMKAIINNSGFGPQEPERQYIQSVRGINRDFILQEVKPRFRGKKGRTVPVCTRDLANLKKTYWDYSDLRFIKGETWNMYINNVIYHISDEQVVTDGAEAYLITRFLRLLETGYPNESCSAPGLRGVVGPENYLMTDVQKVIAVRNALSDFQNGQIPFYEYDYSTGHVLSHGDVIWNGPDLDEIFSEDAVNQMIVNFSHPNRTEE